MFANCEFVAPGNVDAVRDDGRHNCAFLTSFFSLSKKSRIKLSHEIQIIASLLHIAWLQGDSWDNIKTLASFLPTVHYC